MTKCLHENFQMVFVQSRLFIMQVEVAHSLLTRVDWIWKRVLEMQRGGCNLLRRTVYVNLVHLSTSKASKPWYSKFVEGRGKLRKRRAQKAAALRHFYAYYGWQERKILAKNNTITIRRRRRFRIGLGPLRGSSSPFWPFEPAIEG